jgi:hypothetical protein
VRLLILMRHPFFRDLTNRPERQAQLKSQKHQKQKATKAPAKPRVQKKLVMAKKLSDKMYVEVGNGCQGWRWDGVGCGGCRWI